MEDLIAVISKKLNITVQKSDIIVYTDGATESLVFSIKKKYLVKKTDDLTIKAQVEFLEKYKSIPQLQKVLFYDTELKYICFKYIEGEKIKNAKNVEPKKAVDEIVEVLKQYQPYEYDGYGYLFEDHKSWADFLQSECSFSGDEIKNDNVNQEKVKKSLDIIKNYKIKQQLINGDDGTHNILINDKGNISIIDPIPVIGDYLYEFYYCVFSDIFMLKAFSSEEILSYFPNEDLKKKLATFIIALFIRMGRAKVYFPDDFPSYLNYYNKIDFL